MKISSRWDRYIDFGAQPNIYIMGFHASVLGLALRNKSIECYVRSACAGMVLIRVSCSHNYRLSPVNQGMQHH